jgi:hypothetical protein
MRKDNNTHRKYQRQARYYNIPDSLLLQSNVQLLPLYLEIERHAMVQKDKFCRLSDQQLADHLEVNKSTIVRQRLRLESMGMVVIIGSHSSRQVWPWHTYCLELEKAGDTEALDQLLLKALARPVQAKVFDPAPAHKMLCPDDDLIKTTISSRYNAPSFHSLETEAEMRQALDQFAVASIADLCWLFGQECTALIYDRYRRLVAYGKIKKVQDHAVAYAWSTRHNARYMMDLAKYLDPQNPGYKKPIRDRAASSQPGKSGLTGEQAQLLQQLQKNTELNDLF